MASKFILHYVENCEPKLKVFKTKKAYEKFVKNFKETSEDDFLDFVVKGEMELVIDQYYKRFL